MPIVAYNFEVGNTFQAIFVCENEVDVRFLAVLDVSEITWVLLSFVDDVVDGMHFAHGAHIRKICTSIIVNKGITIWQVIQPTRNIVHVACSAVKIAAEKRCEGVLPAFK